MIRLAAPSFSEAALEAVTAVLRSGRLVQGEQVERFEGELAAYLGARHVVAVSSGTAALHLSLVANGIRPGDEVIVPAFTFPATANTVVLAGGVPKLVDVDPEDFCIAPARIEEAITPRTRVLMPVHEFGQPADMEPIVDLAKRYGLVVIEDAACALGARVGVRRVGTIGACGCFSFHPRKALTTGEGGAIATDDAKAAERLRLLRNHGMVQTPDGPDFVAAGFNYRMTEFQAVLGLEQLLTFDRSLAARATQASMYDERLEAMYGLTLPARRRARESVYQTYHVVLPPGAERRDVIHFLRGRGVETNLGAQALNCLSFFRRVYGYGPESCPNATKAFVSGLALPIGAHCGEEELERVVEGLGEALRRVGASGASGGAAVAP